MTAEQSGTKHGFAFATTDASEIWSDRHTTAVFIATRHDLHAELVIAALRAGKHVFVEKPLCIRLEELVQIEDCIRELGESCPVLTVGFNRRFAAATAQLRDFFARSSPLSISYRFASGALPGNHWTQDEETGGGRIVGEACHAIDTCVAIAGSSPVRVFAESVGSGGALETSDDRAFITLRHANGSTSSISYQAAADPSFPAERIEVIANGRCAVAEGWTSIQFWTGGRRRQWRSGKDLGHRAELRAFLTACRSGGHWPIPWGELYSVAEAAMLAMRSLRDGLPQSCGELSLPGDRV
jgi:predicted dehydrogenase